MDEPTLDATDESLKFSYEPETRTRLYAKDAQCSQCLVKFIIRAGVHGHRCPPRGPLRCFMCGKPPGMQKVRCRCEELSTPTPPGVTVVPWLVD